MKGRARRGGFFFSAGRQQLCRKKPAMLPSLSLSSAGIRGDKIKKTLQT